MPLSKLSYIYLMLGDQIVKGGQLIANKLASWLILFPVIRELECRQANPAQNNTGVYGFSQLGSVAY